MKLRCTSFQEELAASKLREAEANLALKVVFMYISVYLSIDLTSTE